MTLLTWLAQPRELERPSTGLPTLQAVPGRPRDWGGVGGLRGGLRALQPPGRRAGGGRDAGLSLLRLLCRGCDRPQLRDPGGGGPGDGGGGVGRPVRAAGSPGFGGGESGSDLVRPSPSISIRMCDLPAVVRSRNHILAVACPGIGGWRCWTSCTGGHVAECVKIN